MKTTPARNLGLDVIRAFGIPYIACYYHVLLIVNLESQKNILTSHIAWIIMSSLILVSGYFIASKNISFSWPEIYSFFQKRIIRIYPLYILAIIAFGITGVAQWSQLLKALFLLSMFLPPGPLTLWFITLIFLFYFLAPILLVSSKSLKQYLLTFAGLIFLFSIYHLFINYIDLRILRYFPAFALGIAIRRFDHLYLLLKRYKILLFFLAFLSLYLSLIKTGSPSDFRQFIKIVMAGSGTTIFLTICSFFVFWLSSNSSELWKRLNLSSVISFLSYISFCLYLFHRPILAFTQNNVPYPSDSKELLIVIYIISVPVMILISWIVQKSYDLYLEKIFNNYL